ncbi:MAG TPA: hypothetical protein VKB14_01270 [Actinomycetales bacterium]|nr:hypothetical protein [Actinomycetales bacterium]
MATNVGYISGLTTSEGRTDTADTSARRTSASQTTSPTYFDSAYPSCGRRG